MTRFRVSRKSGSQKPTGEGDFGLVSVSVDSVLLPPTLSSSIMIMRCCRLRYTENRKTWDINTTANMTCRHRRPIESSMMEVSLRTATAMRSAYLPTPVARALPHDLRRPNSGSNYDSSTETARRLCNLSLRTAESCGIKKDPSRSRCSSGVRFSPVGSPSISSV
jgi:hypothetical protein